MIPVSEALKSAFNPNDGEGGRQIDYSVPFEFIAEEAQAEAVPAADELEEVSQLGQLLDRASAADFASFELGGWILDGEQSLLPDDLSALHTGLVMPERSDADGHYATPQVLELTTVSFYNLIAVTLDFGPSPAADFSVVYYDGSTLLHTVAVTDNAKSVYLAAKAVEGVNRVVVSITRSAFPRRYARISGFLYGALIVYDKSNSESMSLTESIDPMNERVPAGELKITAENFAGNFDIFDPTGIYAFFRDRQRLTPEIGALTAAGAWGYVGKGHYYLQRPKLSGNLSKLNLTAVGILGVLADTVYSTGTYKTATLAQLAEDVAADAGVAVSHPPSLSEITVSAYIPSVSHAEAFRRIAQASNTILRPGLSGDVVFESIGEIVLQTLGKEDYRMTSGFSPSDDDIINTVALEQYTLTAAASAEPLAEATGTGTHYLSYDPSTGHSAAITGGAITAAAYYADNAVITITGGTVAVSGKKIVSGKSAVTATTAQASDRRYTYEVKGNLLIQGANGAAVAAYMLALRAIHRKSIKVEYRGYPYLEPGDVIDFNTGGAETPPYFATKSTLKLAGGMTGTLESRER